MSSVLYEWETFRYRYRLCKFGARVEGWVKLSPMAASWVLRAMLKDSVIRNSLDYVLRREYILAARQTDYMALEREIERGSIFVLEQPLPPVSFSVPTTTPAPEPSPVREPALVTAWIDVTVVDDSLPPRPLGGARFRLSLPDSSTLTGALDGQGHLRVDGIEPGKAWLEFTDVNRDLTS